MRPRSRLSRVLVLVVLAGLLTTPVSAQPAGPPQAARDPSAALTNGQLTLTFVTSGLDQPLGVVNAGDGTDRLFVVEQRGTVRVVSGGQLQPGFFLDIRLIAGGFSAGGERGLLGLAFHPDFETNGLVFAYYTDGDQGLDLGGDVTITQLTANAAGTMVPVASADPILEIEHSPSDIHSGGQLQWGPDGHLYVFTGDGGGLGDPGETSQDPELLLGKVLRIAPDLAGEYTIPADNPFIGPSDGVADEIWALGLRNPWRASFDRETDDLWIGDVGNAAFEEINRQAGASAGGQNYGWDCREGAHDFTDTFVDNPPGIPCPGPFTDPHLEYAHTPQICAVVAGYVYRGTVFPDMAGQLVLGDFCSGELWTLDAASVTPALQEHRDTSIRFTSFGESESGELYVTDRRGGLYRVVAPPYSDVADHSLIDHIMWLTNEGISAGCGGGMYCPNASVSRAQMAAFLARALDLPATNEDHFTDDDGHPLEVSINRVAQAGIATGCATDRYCPNAPVTRAQMASFLDRAFDFPDTGMDFFTDDTGLTHEPAINRLRAANVTGGCTPTTYCPQASTTRAQMAAFLHRAMGD